MTMFDFITMPKISFSLNKFSQSFLPAQRTMAPAAFTMDNLPFVNGEARLTINNGFGVHVVTVVFGVVRFQVDVLRDNVPFYQSDVTPHRRTLMHQTESQVLDVMRLVSLLDVHGRLPADEQF